MPAMNGMGPPAPGPAPMGPPAPPMAGAQNPNQTMMEARRAQIMAMPEGPEKDAAIAALVADYQGLGAAAEDQQSFGAKAALMDMPEGVQTGGKYGTYVAASPLEHLAAGLRTYGGYKDMGQARDARQKLADEKQAAMVALLKAQP